MSGPDRAEQLFKDRTEVTLSWSEGWADRQTEQPHCASYCVHVCVCVRSIYAVCKPHKMRE